MQVNLVDICKPKQWKTIAASKLKNDGFPVYGANGKIGYYSEYTHEYPTILVTCRGATCGAINICEPKSYVNGNAMALDDLAPSVDLKYLYYILTHRGFNDVISGSAQPQITRTNLKNLKIPLPPLAEQQKIAAILDAADQLRQKDAQLIEHYNRLSQSLFLDMFGDPVTNPKGWEIKDFGSLITTLTDYHANGSYKTLKENIKLKKEKDYALMVRTTDLEKKNFSDDVIYISKMAYDYLSKSKVYGGEIIISKIGSAGKVYLMPYLNTPVSLGMNAFLLRFSKDLNNLFAYFLLTSSFGDREIGRRIKGAVTKTIRKDAIREIKIILPPIKLQNQFAQYIKAIEQQKQQAQASLEKSEALFNSLLQHAFKGELTA